MTYKEKLLSPRWQKIRLEVFNRDNWVCKNCNSHNKNLQVHHLEYLGIDPWDYPMDMLVTLCDDCHDKETGREQLEKHLGTTFKMQGFLASDLIALSCILETEPNFRNYLKELIRKFHNG